MCDRPLVVGLGPVKPDVVMPILDPWCRFVPEPTAQNLSEAVAALHRASFDLTRETLDQMPNLKVIARTGVGVDRVDVAAAAERSIPVVIAAGANTNAVAEGAWALIMSLVKRLGVLTDLVREGGWDRRESISIGDLEDHTIGIVGYGRIGQRVAHLAEAFGMNVRAYGGSAVPPPPVGTEDLSEIFAECDVVSLHLPLTPQTHHIVNDELLAHMKPRAVLVNTGRGGLIDHDAALRALTEGSLGGVGLDVFEPEPPEHHPLFDHPDVVLTPHVAGLTAQAGDRSLACAAQGVVDVLRGKIPGALAPGSAPVPIPAIIDLG